MFPFLALYRCSQHHIQGHYATNDWKFPGSDHSEWKRQKSCSILIWRVHWWLKQYHHVWWWSLPSMDASKQQLQRPHQVKFHWEWHWWSEPREPHCWRHCKISFHSERKRPWRRYPATDTLHEAAVCTLQWFKTVPLFLVHLHSVAVWRRVRNYPAEYEARYIK